jgi:hypothetical protein
MAENKLPPDSLKSVFDYLDKEIAFHGAFSALCGAATAWLAGTLLFTEVAKQPPVLQATMIGLRGMTVAKLAIGSFGLAALLALIHRGQLARRYGVLARKSAQNEEIIGEDIRMLIRQAQDAKVVLYQWEYYSARFFLYLGVAMSVLLSLYV